MEYKTRYSHGELEELRQWFVAHKDELPRSFEMSSYNFIKDMDMTVETIIIILSKPNKSVAFSGHYHQLFVLRDKLAEYLKHK